MADSFSEGKHNNIKMQRLKYPYNLLYQILNGVYL